MTWEPKKPKHLLLLMGSTHCLNTTSGEGRNPNKHCVFKAKPLEIVF